MAITVSKDGMSTVNLNDRLSPILDHHAKMAFVFQYDLASRSFTLNTTSLTVFQFGNDDTFASPATLSGYDTAAAQVNSIDLTSAYKGGAWSILTPRILLSVGLIPESLRVIGTDVAGTAAAAGTAVVPRNTGCINTELNAQFDDFWTAATHGQFLNILPPGNNSMCSAFLGISQFMNAGAGVSNSPVMSYPGQNRPESRYTFGTEVFVEPNIRNMGDFTPNRLLFTNGVNVSRVSQLAASAPLTNTALVALDVIVKVVTANVEFSNNGENYDAPEWDLLSKRRIAYFRGENSCFAI